LHMTMELATLFWVVGWGFDGHGCSRGSRGGVLLLPPAGH
jgi:hypothetical protein